MRIGSLKDLTIKKFTIPSYYRSSITGRIKDARRITDFRKEDFSPSLLDFGPVQFYLARHFGFCYGVENAIEKSYKALEENQNKRIYLLSQMIHNQEVNQDLQSRGIRFIMDTDGTPLIPLEEVTPDDIVIIPAFGTTLEIEHQLLDKGIEVEKYNTTCPFVEKVWNRSARLGDSNFTVIIHGKPGHEETRATFSHSKTNAPSIIVRDMDDARRLGKIMLGELSADQFSVHFANRCSDGFDPGVHLDRVGVVNQTTMLATETQAIANYFREVMIAKFGASNIKEHFADTRDTLCYATNDNQDATYQLMNVRADLALVVGGYNSSNTSHIVELCEQRFPTYFINSEREVEATEIHHFDIHQKKRILTNNYLPTHGPLKIVLTSGASCPDTLVDRVLVRVLEFFPESKALEDVLTSVLSNSPSR